MAIERSDAVLVARVRQGDDEAFEAIVRRHREPLGRYAARLMGGSAADADDVVQEALLRALAGLRATDRPMALRPWLFMIVRNRALDHLRAPARRRNDGDARLALAPALGADPEERAAARATFDAVVAAVAALPARQRLALVERELGGSSHVELAERLGTTVPGAKSLLVRARRATAEALAA